MSFIIEQRHLLSQLYYYYGKSGCPCAIFFYNIVDLNTLCVVCGDSPLHDKISTYTRHAYRMAHALIIHYTQIIL